MSSYLHAFPVNDKFIEVFAEECGLSFDGITEGRVIRQEEFNAIVRQLEPYEYNLDDDGSLSLRRGYDEDLFFILHEVTKLCGPQIVCDDNMNAMIITQGTTLRDLEKLSA